MAGDNFPAILRKNDSPLWPCCDSSCSQRCTWHSRWPVWSRVTPQRRPPLYWCSVDSSDATSSPYLALLGSPSHVGRGKDISSQYSPPWTRPYCPQTPGSLGSLLQPAGDHNQFNILLHHKAAWLQHGCWVHNACIFILFSYELEDIK